MSTAEVARDMDVLRRMVGDKKLTYLGFSYGTYLGNVYANLFPDRVRALVIDGVLDPVAWAGTPENRNIPQTQRLKSGEGASKALRRDRSRGAPPPARSTASSPASATRRPSTPRSSRRSRRTRSRSPDETGEPLFELTYPILVGLLLGDLYAPKGSTLRGPGPRPSSTASSTRPRPTRAPAPCRRSSRPVPGRARADRRRTPASRPGSRTTTRPRRSRACCAPTGSTRRSAEDWVPASAAADAAAPGFGPLWTWASAPCASSTWTVRDEDAYTGPFTHRTAAPVLVVGNYWDPATNYDGAVAAAKLLPQQPPAVQRLWGHTAYGTSACVTDAVDAYLLTGATPAAGTVCTGDVQPFTEPLVPDAGPQSRRAAPARPLPPVVPPLPGALPRS